MRILRNASLLSLLSLMACGGIPTQRFEFDAIDTESNKQPCLIVIGNDFGGAVENKQVVNLDGDRPLGLDIQFEQPEVVIMAIPLKVDENGKVVKMPSSRSEARNLARRKDDSRTLRLRDPKMQLFVLQRDKGAN
jgi:hypothetical protein